jgi:hypothetical protein
LRAADRECAEIGGLAEIPIDDENDDESDTDRDDDDEEEVDEEVVVDGDQASLF